MSDQLPPHARALLTALQREDTPDAEEQRRVKQQVFARLGLGAIGAAAATTTTVASHATTSAAGSVATAGTSGGGLGSLLAAKLGTAKVVLGLTAALATAGGAALLSRTNVETTEVTQPTPAFSHGVFPASSEAPALPPEPVAEEQATPEPSAAQPKATRGTGSATGNRPSSPSSLEEEAQLLSQAHQQVSQGNPRAALTVLLEHQRRFPRGTLSLERQATLAVARCLAGDTTRGRADAERFRRKHPNSPMVKRLESVCQLAER